MVKNIFKFGLNAFTSKQTNIFSAAFFIILTTIFAQILGLVKYRLYVSIFGTPDELGVFLAAYKVPDFLFQVLIASALTSIFIPMFSDYIVHKKEAEGYKFASSLTVLAVVGFIIISIIVALFAYPISRLVAPGFTPAELSLMTNFTRIILISQVFFILGTVATCVLQSYQQFLVPGIASALYNVGIIIGLLTLTRTFGIYGAAIGTLVGSLLFFISQIPSLMRSGFVFSFIFTIDESVKKVLHLMIPRAFTLLVTQIVIIANTFFASFISARSIVHLEFAQTLMIAPVLLFGQSIAQASFPALSQKVHDKKEFMSIFVASFNQILYLTLPISVLFIVLRIPVVRLLYGASKFDWESTVTTGLTLAYFSLSLGAQALMYLLSRAFYAYKNTHTPFIITSVSVGINVALSALFVWYWKFPVYALALSFSVSNIIAAAAMLYCLNRITEVPKQEIFSSFIKILIATFTMGFALYIPIKLLDQLVFDTTRTINLFILTGISSFFGLLSFVFFTWLLEIKEAYYILQVIQRFSLRNNILKQIGELLEGPKV